VTKLAHVATHVWLVFGQPRIPILDTSLTEVLQIFRHYRKTVGYYFKLGHDRFLPNHFRFAIHCYNRQNPLIGSMTFPHWNVTYRDHRRLCVGLPTKFHIKDY